MTDSLKCLTQARWQVSDSLSPNRNQKLVKDNRQFEASRRAIVMMQGRLVRIERMVLQLVGAQDGQPDTIDGKDASTERELD